MGVGRIPRFSLQQAALPLSYLGLQGRLFFRIPKKAYVGPLLYKIGRVRIGRHTQEEEKQHMCTQHLVPELCGAWGVTAVPCRLGLTARTGTNSGTQTCSGRGGALLRLTAFRFVVKAGQSGVQPYPAPAGRLPFTVPYLPCLFFVGKAVQAAENPR